jgi:hypothetical protein
LDSIPIPWNLLQQVCSFFISRETFARDTPAKFKSLAIHQTERRARSPSVSVKFDKIRSFLSFLWRW